MLIIYGCTIGTFVFFYLTGAIMVSTDDISKEVNIALYDTMTRYGSDSDVTEAWDTVMEEVSKRLSINRIL